MDKHDRFIAINQTLPGLEDFLKVVLGSEPLSEEANRQRIEFLRRLESVSRPPSLPPRPANLSEIYRTRLQQNEAPSGSFSQDESNVYKNDRTVDPVEFASQQRELSRVTTVYKTYAPQTVIFGEKGTRNGGLYFARPGNTRDGVRDSIQSTSSTEDDIYEHLSLKSVSPSDPVRTQDGDGSIKMEESFVFPSPPKTPQEYSSAIYLPTRSGSLRGSAGKGRLTTGWFKKEAKLNSEVYVSNLREPVIKGYLKDIKANKRRWCVLQGNRLHIFKNQEDPAIMILYLPECNIGVDDKKKISYSFRLIPPDGPGVTLAIEDGHDLSPWMSAIMAAAVRRSSIDRPVSPLEGLFTLEQARAERMHGVYVDGGGIEEEDLEEEEEDIYEKPVDLSVSGTPSAHSTPVTTESKDEEDEGYDAPLPPLPIDDDSSSESSSDEDESMEKVESDKKAASKKKIYDQIPPDLLAELTAGQHKAGNETNKSQDSICDEGSTNDQSLDFTDSHSEHSGNISNRHSYIEPIPSDDTGSSEPKEEKMEDSVSRKRTSTVLSISMESVCSDTEDTRTSSVTSETSVTSKGLGPKVKRRRKLVPAEAELQFLQDPSAMHSGILYQKRRLGVWSKRYCKIIDSRFKCYRNPGDQKPTLNFPILGYDVSLIDNKETKKSYCIKISHPNQETYYFATDSRVSIERWIEVLSLAATGRLDVIAPYPPYFCAEQSGDELKSRSRESLLSSEGRLSDDDSADTLDELDPPSERGQSLNRLKANEGKNRFPAEETNAVLPNDTRNVEVQTQTKAAVEGGGAQQSPETGVKERAHKKRKEKPKEGTKTPSTMSPPHSMFISESVDGQAKPEPMNEEYASRPQGNAKESSEDSSSKKDKRWTETLKKKKLSRGHSYDHRLRGTITSASHPDAKNKHLSMRRKNSQTFVHLMNLFDKEGRFCGYLTEVRYNKFGTTHLRRWCVVKNGVLMLFNSESEDTPQGKLSLVDMWLTDKSDRTRNKFCFMLEDKDGNGTTLQTTVKEDFQKWMGVLELFTELRVERPQPEVAADPLRKADSYGGEEGEGTFERGTLRTKSSRAAAKLKEEIYALAPGKVRTSLRMKLSQRVNVRDIFRKTHSSYDLEGGALNEGSSLPEADIDTLAVFGGNLTQVEPNGSTNSRWCTIKEKELLIFSDRKASDPLRRIPLLSSTFSDLSDGERNPHRFQVRYGNVNIVFDACDKFDHNRWLRMLASATERRNSSDDDRPKCVGRLTSPTFTKKKILHRRTRSEALSQEGETPTSASKTREGSTSSTDRLMSGYLQEVRETNGARTLLRRWCVATSEKFIVYENQNSTKASFEWELSEMSVQDQSDMDAGSFGFCVLLGEEKLCFKVIDEDSARHWLSVLARYCHPVAANEPLFKPPPRQKSKEDRRRSASDNDLKSKPTEESDVLEVLSEGRASGQKLLRRATEDSTFFRKFNRSELFKAPWRASTEKLEVKMRDRERSGRAAANKALKRFSCGSLFDSDGKYSGYLMELITSELYSSQVRRWCVQKDDYLYVYENEAADNHIKVVPLFNAKVVDTSDIEGCVYRFRIDYGEGKAVFFRALGRTDLEKWTTIISVKTAVLQDRSERQLRRSRTFSSEKSSSESEVTSPELKPARSLTADSASLNETVSICSADSVFVPASDPVKITSATPVSTVSKPVGSNDEAVTSSVELRDEQSSNDQRNDLSSAEKTVSEAESSDSNRKTVSRLSSIEDLSHIYENFLAFASAMAEKSPQFQEQLYHVYENVTQAFDNGGLKTTENEGQIAEELPEETNEANELGSPSMEMSSEFEKISLRENEEKDNSYVYRDSGICGEPELEKLVEDSSEKEQDVIDAAAEGENSVQNEASQDDEVVSCGLAGETDPVAVSNSRVGGEILEVPVSSGGEEDLAINAVVGQSEQETLVSRNENEVEELQNVENDTGFIRVEDSFINSDEQYEFQLESAENVNEVITSQTSVQDESVGENEVEVNSRVHTSRPLVRADHLSAVETGESSLYLAEQVNDQAWSEIEDNEFSEPVVETSVVLDAVRVSTPCGINWESLLDGDSLASAVEKTALSEDDEDRASNVEIQDSKDALEGTGEECNSENDDESLNKLEVSETEPPCFGAVENEDYKKELQAGERDVEGDKMWNNADRVFEANENVCAAESFESSLPLTLKCSKEAEVRCEQTLATEVCESEHAQMWEEAATSVEESPSSTTQDYELESHALLESPNSDLESEDFTSADNSLDVQPNEMCRHTDQEDTVLNNFAESLSCSLPSQTNLEDASPETELDSLPAVETYFGSETISNFLEVRPAEANQLEKKPAGAFAFCHEHAEELTSAEPDLCSNDSLGSELVKDVNPSLRQDEEPEDALDEGIELEKRCSSSEGYYTPEDTIDLLVRSDSIAEEESRAESSANSRTQSSDPELSCTENKTKTTEEITAPCAEHADETQKEHDLVREPETETESKNSQSQPLDTWSNHSSLGDTQDLTKSQIDILKAVTAAFEEILELHGEDSDTDDTRL